MFALRSGQRAGQAGRNAARTSVDANRFVPPRWLRRPIRLFARLGTGDFTAPRFAATIASTALFAATGIYGTFLAGSMLLAAQAITARTGFAVNEVKVVGHRETSEIDVLDKIGLDGWTSLIGLDVEAARARIDELPWVQLASVRKIYPDLIEVRIEEKQPFAIWQNGKNLSVIGETGNIIAPFTGGNYRKLPLVVGAGAATSAAAFIAKVGAYPKLAQRVKGYIQVADRRWDLRLDNGVTVRLPEMGLDEALADLVAMDRASALFSRDIVAVDMRLADRVFMQLSPAASEARQATLAAEGKIKKKAGNKV